MSRIIYVIRHGQSEGNRHNRAAFGKEGGALVKAGIEEAKLLKDQFAKLGIDTTTEPVAISGLKRTYETALYAGFTNFIEYSLLNEINSGLDPSALDGMIEQKKLPEIALKAARTILESPPKERVWVTHGMVIGALAHELGIPTDELFIPSMGSITKLELNVLPGKRLKA